LPIQDFGRDSVIRANVLVAIANFLQGDQKAAVSAGDKALALITNAPPTASYLLHHYGALTEIYLSLWETHPDDSTYQKSAQAMYKALQSFARVFPIGKPRAALCQGKFLYLSGKPEPATRLWDSTLPIAREMVMPFDEGLLLLALGRYGEPTTRSQHLTEALNVFTRIHASYAINLVQDAMRQA
jgi:hypothetical protein